MFIFREEESKVHPRKGALGFKQLIIEDDVTLADDIDIKFDIESETPSIIIHKSDGEDNLHLFVNEFAVFNNIENELIIIACDDGMFIELERGAVLIKNPMDDSPMLVHHNISESDLKRIDMNKVKWVDTQGIDSFTSYYGDWSESHNIDYIHTVIVKSSDEYTLRVKRIEETDISLGGFDILDKKKQAKEVRTNMLRTSRAIEEARRQNAMCEYDDEDEDDYDDYDDDEDLI